MGHIFLMLNNPQTTPFYVGFEICLLKTEQYMLPVQNVEFKNDIPMKFISLDTSTMQERFSGS